MPFTDRFIRLPIKIYSVSQAELTGKENYEDAVARVNPFEISRYYPIIEDVDDNDVPAVKITFKDGESMVTYMTIEAFEALLDKQ